MRSNRRNETVRMTKKLLQEIEEELSLWQTKLAELEDDIYQMQLKVRKELKA